MNDKTLFERLRGIAGMLRAVGGFDDMADHFEEAATRIEALEVALRYCIDTPHSGWTIAQTVAKQALESQP